MKDIELPAFTPRGYQRGVMSALDLGYKRIVLVCHRRWGKDMCCINTVAKEAFKRVGNYYYYLPSQTMARKIVWNGIDSGGKRFIDYLPGELVRRKLDKEMMVEFVNGSTLQLAGTDNTEVVGVNPVGCLFSEYALHDQRVWQFIQPILRENGGWAMFQSTPRGKFNHLYRLYDGVKGDPAWYVEKQNILDTKVIKPEEVENDIRNGLITRKLAMQEYYCDFIADIEGSYYGELIDEAEKEGRIGKFEYLPGHPVWTSWDLGYNDNQCVWFFQLIEKGFGGNYEIRWIDFFSERQKGMEYYADMLMKKQNKYGWRYGGHYAPHDVDRHNVGTGQSIRTHAEENGIYFERVPLTSRVINDIEIVRRNFRKFTFNKEAVLRGLDSLASYSAKVQRRKGNEDDVILSDKPDHASGSDEADSLRTGVMAWHYGMINDYGFGDIKVRNSVSMSDTYGGHGKEVLKKNIFDEVMFDTDKGGLYGEETYGD